jgi:hypothetical protein
MWRCEFYPLGLECGPVVGCFVHSNGPLGFIRVREILMAICSSRRTLLNGLVTCLFVIIQILPVYNT